MKQFNYMKKNKYRGIAMAKFEAEKKTLENFRSRNKEKVEELNRNASEEKIQIAELEKRKEEALLSGSQEEFLNLSEQLRRKKDSLEFYTKRAESLKEKARVKEEEILELSKRIREEQNRLNRDSLKWLHTELEGVISVLAEVDRELTEGDSLLAEAIQLFRKDVPEKEFIKTVEKIPGYSSFINSVQYPERAINQLLGTLRGHIDYLEQPSMKKWLEGE